MYKPPQVSQSVSPKVSKLHVPVRRRTNAEAENWTRAPRMHSASGSARRELYMRTTAKKKAIFNQIKKIQCALNCKTLALHMRF